MLPGSQQKNGHIVQRDPANRESKSKGCLGTRMAIGHTKTNSFLLAQLHRCYNGGLAPLCPYAPWKSDQQKPQKCWYMFHTWSLWVNWSASKTKDWIPCCRVKTSEKRLTLVVSQVNRSDVHESLRFVDHIPIENWSCPRQHDELLASIAILQWLWDSGKDLQLCNTHTYIYNIYIYKLRMYIVAFDKHMYTQSFLYIYIN